MAQLSPPSTPIAPSADSSAAPSLAQWFYRALGRTDWSIKTQQRGNTLHMMVEAEVSPAAQVVLQPLVEVLLEQDLAAVLPESDAPVYVIMLYGRGLGQKKPRWKTPLYLNQLPHYHFLLEQQRQLQQQGQRVNLASDPEADSELGSTVQSTAGPDPDADGATPAPIAISEDVTAQNVTPEDATNNRPIDHSPTQHGPTQHSPTQHSPIDHSPIDHSPIDRDPTQSTQSTQSTDSHQTAAPVTGPGESLGSVPSPEVNAVSETASNVASSTAPAQPVAQGEIEAEYTPIDRADGPELDLAQLPVPSVLKDLTLELQAAASAAVTADGTGGTATGGTATDRTGLETQGPGVDRGLDSSVADDSSADLEIPDHLRLGSSDLDHSGSFDDGGGATNAVDSADAAQPVGTAPLVDAGESLRPDSSGSASPGANLARSAHGVRTPDASPLDVGQSSEHPTLERAGTPGSDRSDDRSSHAALPPSTDPALGQSSSPVTNPAHHPSLDSSPNPSLDLRSASPRSDSPRSGSASDPIPGSTPGSPSPLDDLDLIRTNRQRAREGDLTAIAYYLSETLSALGVSVQVGARTVIHRSATTLSESLNRVQHLYIVCQSSYALNPAVVADPIAQRLRALQLQGFQDAAVVSQVQGETQADWVLRVDLTPPSTILKSLVRWGDLAACREWLGQILAPQGLGLELDLKDKTLHLFCRVLQPHQSPPAKADLLALFQSHLHTLAPQGIHAAMVYSLPYSADPTGDGAKAVPLWVDWMELPGAKHPDLMPTARELAEQGDLAAILYLLDRQVNPNLGVQLATGGVRVQLRQRGDLIHIMCDAPTCPRQNEVGSLVAKHIQQLRLPQVAGVRVYGRRAGQKRPLWTYGADFGPRQRQNAEATPDFGAATDPLEDLLRVPGLNEPVETEDLELAEESGFSWQELVEWGRQTLIRSQFFVPTEEASTQVLTSEPLPAVGRSGGGGSRSTALGHQLRVAAVWASLGLMVALKADWGLGYWLQRAAALEPESAATRLSDSFSTGELSPAQLEAALPPPSSLDSLDWTQPEFADLLPGTGAEPGDAFTDTDEESTAGRFTQVSSALFPQGLPENFSLRLQNPETGLFATPDYPEFNNPLLSQKLLLYQHYLVNGQVPDILIVGSSRALRGVDPAVLSQELAKLGYPGLRIFNFAINGSTAQVVDFQLRQILAAEQLPQLIIWADGARAFNSGRVDVTYNAIGVSEGFEQYQNQSLPPLVQAMVVTETETETTATATTSTWLDQLQSWETGVEDQLARVSSVYGDRDRLKGLVSETLAKTLPQNFGKWGAPWNQTLPPEQFAPESRLTLQSDDPLDPEFSRLPDAPEGEGNIRMDGFLPLSLRFNPATYYQKYARVQGAYDSDYQDFRVEGKQEEALDRLLTYVETQDVPVVFVNLPLTDDYLDPVRWDHEETFQSYMYQMMTDQRLIFRDLSDLWPMAFDNFSDPSHLNRFGALEVSQHLADDPLIPWPRSRAVMTQSSAVPPLDF